MASLLPKRAAASFTAWPMVLPRSGVSEVPDTYEIALTFSSPAGLARFLGKNALRVMLLTVLAGGKGNLRFKLDFGIGECGLLSCGNGAGGVIFDLDGRLDNAIENETEVFQPAPVRAAIAFQNVSGSGNRGAKP